MFYKNVCSHYQRLFERGLTMDGCGYSLLESLLTKIGKDKIFVNCMKDLHFFKDFLGNLQCFYFYRIVLRDIREIPPCPIMQWVYTQEMCSCCVRIGIFHLLIQDWICFQMRLDEFNMYEAYLQFSRVYWHSNPFLPFLFPELH